MQLLSRTTQYTVQMHTMYIWAWWIKKKYNTMVQKYVWSTKSDQLIYVGQCFFVRLYFRRCDSKNEQMCKSVHALNVGVKKVLTTVHCLLYVVLSFAVCSMLMFHSRKLNMLWINVMQFIILYYTDRRKFDHCKRNSK